MTVVQLRRRRTCARSCPTRSRSTSSTSPAARCARARGSSTRSCRRALRCDGCERDVGARRRRRSAARAAAAADVAVEAGERARGRVDRGREEASMHRVKVRVVEDALDANNTIARANRDDFDRHGVDRRQPDERARAPARRRCSSARSRDAARRRARRRARGRRAGLARRRPRSPALHVPGDAAQHRLRLRRRVPPRRQHGALGAARRCRSTRSTCS